MINSIFLNFAENKNAKIGMEEVEDGKIQFDICDEPEIK